MTTTRVLTRRLVARNPGQALLIGIVCAVAIVTGIATHHHALDAERALERAGELRHGTISVVVDSPIPPGSTTLSHGHDRQLPWIPSSLQNEVATTAAGLGIRLVPRTEAAVSTPDGEVRAMIAIGADDPALALIDRSPPIPGADRFSIAVRRGDDAPVEWHEIPDEALIGTSADRTVWVTHRWMDGLIGDATPSANVLVATPPGGNAFALAFELSERTRDTAPPVRVFAWPELVGYERYVGTGSAAGLLRPLVLVVAAVAVAGMVTVAIRNRVMDTIVLRTIGFETAVIRRIYVREIATGSVGAALLVLAALGVLSFLGADPVVDAQVGRTLLAGAVLPPFVAFHTARRELRDPLARVRREAGL